MPSAYHTSAFLLEGVLVLGDALEKRVVSCLGLHIILDFLSCLRNLWETKVSLLLRIHDLVSPKKTGFWTG